MDDPVPSCDQSAAPQCGEALSNHGADMPSGSGAPPCASVRINRWPASKAPFRSAEMCPAGTSCRPDPTGFANAFLTPPAKKVLSLNAGACVFSSGLYPQRHRECICEDPVPPCEQSVAPQCGGTCPGTLVCLPNTVEFRYLEPGASVNKAPPPQLAAPSSRLHSKIGFALQLSGTSSCVAARINQFLARKAPFRSAGICPDGTDLPPRHHRTLPMHPQHSPL